MSAEGFVKIAGTGVATQSISGSGETTANNPPPSELSVTFENGRKVVRGGGVIDQTTESEQ